MCLQVLSGPELRGAQQDAEGQAEEVFTEGKQALPHVHST